MADTLGRGGGGTLPIYCSIPMLGPQRYGFWHNLPLLRRFESQWRLDLDHTSA